MNKKKYFPLIILELKGGFGNLLFQISAANKFSNDFNSRIVVFDESKTKNQILKKFLNFNYPDASNTELFYAAKEIKNDNLIFRLTKRLMRKLGLHFAKYFHGGHFEPLNYNTKNFNKKILYLDGYYQHPSFYKDSVNYITNLYSQNTIQLDHPIDQTIIHLRRADYINHGWDLPLKYYINSLEKIDSKRKYKIKIISDDNFAAIGLANVCSAMGFTVLENLVYDDKLNFIEVVNSKNIIMSNSSFSWWAATISQNIFLNSDRKVTYPKGWLLGFNDVLKNDSWIEIETSNKNARNENYGNSLEFYTKQNQNKLEI